MSREQLPQRPQAPISPWKRSPDRPQSIGVNARGIEVYSPAEVKAYRCLAGVKQTEVAAKLYVGQGFISTSEDDRRELQGRQANAILDAVEALVAERMALVAEGERIMAALADGTYVKGMSRGRMRSPAEAAAILAAQARGER